MHTCFRRHRISGSTGDGTGVGCRRNYEVNRITRGALSAFAGYDLPGASAEIECGEKTLGAAGADAMETDRSHAAALRNAPHPKKSRFVKAIVRTQRFRTLRRDARWLRVCVAELITNPKTSRKIRTRVSTSNESSWPQQTPKETRFYQRPLHCEDGATDSDLIDKHVKLTKKGACGMPVQEPAITRGNTRTHP